MRKKAARHHIYVIELDREARPACDVGKRCRVFLIPVFAERRVMVGRHHPGARMPVTAKLSRKFYEKFGDDIANELVDWFNMVDATYRSELRELNELNFERFDAKLEQRLAELETRLTKRLFGFWVGQAATTAALGFGVGKL